MSLPDHLLARLGVPGSRSLTDLARIAGCSLSVLSRGDPGMARALGHAADLLDGIATGTAEATDPIAWSRGCAIAAKIEKERGEPEWSASALAQQLGAWGLEMAPEAQARLAELLIELGAEGWWLMGGWAEVHRRARGVLA